MAKQNLDPFPTPDVVTAEQQRRTRMRDAWQDPVVESPEGSYNPFLDAAPGQRQRAEYRAVHDYQWQDRESRRLAAEQRATFSGRNDALRTPVHEVIPIHVHAEGSVIARRQGYGRKLF